jgi:hypothetical protein
MRKLSIPVLGLVLVCAFAGPISSIASAATYGSSASHVKWHTMKPKIATLRFHSRFNTPARHIIASSHRRAIRSVSPVGAHLK